MTATCPHKRGFHLPCAPSQYCPGFYDDDKNGDKPGSKPIIVPKGAATEEKVVETVDTEVTLDMDCADFNLTAVKLALAAQYNVDVALISLEDPCATRRVRARALAVLTLSISIATTGTAADGSTVTASPSAAALLSAVQSVDSTSLTASLATALNAVVNVTGTVAQATSKTVVVEKDCPKGHWCTAGQEVKCEVGFYNPMLNINTQTGCLPCMANGWTVREGAESYSECVCRVGLGYIELSDSGGNRMCVCPPGYAPNEATPPRCMPCVVGAYKEGPSNANCDTCPSDATTLAVGATNETDCVCKEDLYDADDSLASRTCVPCPRGTNCTAPGSTIKRLPLARNFWRSHDFSPLPLPCITEGLCEGGVTTCPNAFCTAQLSETRPPPMVNRSAGCAPGNMGPYCENCEPLYYRSAGKCTACPDVSASKVSTFFIVGFAVPGLIVLLGAIVCVRAICGRGGDLRQGLKERAGNMASDKVVDMAGLGDADANADAAEGHEEATRKSAMAKLGRSARALTRRIRSSDKKELGMAAPSLFATLNVDFKILVSLFQVLGALRGAPGKHFDRGMRVHLPALPLPLPRPTTGRPARLPCTPRSHLLHPVPAAVRLHHAQHQPLRLAQPARVHASELPAARDHRDFPLHAARPHPRPRRVVCGVHPRQKILQVRQPRGPDSRQDAEVQRSRARMRARACDLVW